MRTHRLVVALLACSIAAGCDGIACTMIMVPGIRVAVVDSTTGLPPGPGVHGWVQDGAFRDSLTMGDCATSPGGAVIPTVLAGAWERAGTYAITVQRRGYGDWHVDGVRVRSDRCHVIPDSLQARMQPLP